MKYAKIELSGVLRETGRLTKTMINPRDRSMFRLDQFLITTRILRKNKKLKRVLIQVNPDFQAGFSTGFEAIRTELEALKQAGKELYFYSRDYDMGHLYLGSACNHRCIHPLGIVRYKGLSMTFLYMRTMLHKHQIEPYVFRYGKYKSAMDPFRAEEIDEPNQEQWDAILNMRMQEINDTVQAALSISKDDLNALLEGAFINAEKAVNKNWISRVENLFQLEQRWNDEKCTLLPIKKIKPHFGKGKRIAVLFFEGAIIDGKSKQDPLMGQSLGADEYIPHIEALAEDKGIKGVVFRINSGGGSATASDDIAKAIQYLREKKPVVASISEVAGSGGYWLASSAEKIFSHNTSITGSIGVITLLMHISKFLEKHGVTHSVLKSSEFADWGSMFKEPTDKDKAYFETMIQHYYQLFVHHVSEGRQLSKDAVDAVGQGRIWSGKDAKEKGLVDEIGGIFDAIDYLQTALKLESARIEFYPIIKYNWLERKLFQNVRSEVQALTQSSMFQLANSYQSALFQHKNTAWALMPELLGLWDR